jgi:hypothetical protein
MRIKADAVVAAERGSVLTILGSSEPRQAIEALVRDAQDHADWLVEEARRVIPGAESIACREGCSFCCHLHVIATIPEILRIAADLRSRLDSAALTALDARIAAHRAAMGGAIGTERRARRAACPLLENGRCTVYPIRPLSCRGWNSLDVATCEAHFVDSGRALHVPIYEPQHHVNALVQEGMGAGLAAAGLESDRVELVAGLAIALGQTDAAERWLRGERVFAAAQD